MLLLQKQILISINHLKAIEFYSIVNQTLNPKSKYSPQFQNNLKENPKTPLQYEKNDSQFSTQIELNNNKFQFKKK